MPQTEILFYWNVIGPLDGAVFWIFKWVGRLPLFLAFFSPKISPIGGKQWIGLWLWIRPNKNVPLRFIIHGVPVAIKLQRCIRLLSPVGCCRLSQRDQSFGKLVEITNISLQLAAKCLHNQRLFLAPNWNSTWKKFEKIWKNHFQILKIIPAILAIFKWIFFQLICICKLGDIP